MNGHEQFYNPRDSSPEKFVSTESEVEKVKKLSERLAISVEMSLDNLEFLSVDNLIYLIEATQNRVREQFVISKDTPAFPEVNAQLDLITRRIPEWKRRLADAVEKSKTLSSTEYLARVRSSFFGVYANESFDWKGLTPDLEQARRIFGTKIDIYENEGWVTKEQAQTLRDEFEKLLTRAEELSQVFSNP